MNETYAASRVRRAAAFAFAALAAFAAPVASADDDAASSGLAIAAIESQVVDGVHPCSPTLSVSDAEGNAMTEGVDYDVTWPDLAAPGTATVTVVGKEGTASAGLSASATFSIQLAAKPKKRPYLPEGYVELSGITGTGNQYLTTGVKPSASARVECEMNCPKATASYNAAFGQRTDWRSNAFVFYVIFNGQGVGYNRSGAEDRCSTKFPYGERTKVVADGLTATWATDTTSGSIEATGTLTDAKCEMYVFTDNANGRADSTTYMTLHSFRIVEGDVTACELVPCYRVSDGAIGAFDVTHRQPGDMAFRPNIGSGEFLKGEETVRPTATDVSLDFYVEKADATAIGYGWSVNDEDYAGGTLKLEVSEDADFASPSVIDLGTAEAYANVSGTLEGLSPNTERHFRLTLSKDGKEDVVRTLAASTSSAAGRIGSYVSLQWTRPNDPAFVGSVESLGYGDVRRVKLYLGTDADDLKLAATEEVDASGSVSVSVPWPAYYVTVYYKMAYENGTGDDISVSETETFSYLPDYTAEYVWKSDVAEGDWTDAGNWKVNNCTAANPTELYPQRESYHSVAFPQSWTGVVDVAGGEQCLYVAGYANSRGTIRGPAGDELAKITVGAFRINSQGASVVLDRVHLVWTGCSGSTAAGTDHVGRFGGVRLENGAVLDKSVNGWPIIYSNSGAFLELFGGSRMTFANNSNRFMFTGPDSRAVIDDSEFSCNVPVYLNSASSGATTWRIAGASPLLAAGGGLALEAGGTELTFAPGMDGFGRTPVQVGGSGVCLSGAAGKATVSVDEEAPVWRSFKTVDVALVECAAGIDAGSFVLNQPTRKNGKLYWNEADGSGNPTQLRFRMTPPGALIIIR